MYKVSHVIQCVKLVRLIILFIIFHIELYCCKCKRSDYFPSMYKGYLFRCGETLLEKVVAILESRVSCSKSYILFALVFRFSVIIGSR